VEGKGIVQAAWAAVVALALPLGSYYPYVVLIHIHRVLGVEGKGIVQAAWAAVIACQAVEDTAAIVDTLDVAEDKDMEDISHEPDPPDEVVASLEPQGEVGNRKDKVEGRADIDQPEVPCQASPVAAD
jgi:hypothetical protein